MYVSKERGRVVTKLLSIFAFLLITSTIWAQNIKVAGVVTDTKGETLVGISVVLEGTLTAVATALDGSYEINVPQNGVLVFSSIGMRTQRVPVNGRARIDVVLEEDALALQEVVVVGFGTQRRENLTGAVATVDVAKALEARPVADLSRGLQGITPGMTITFSSGQLNTAANIRLRGTGTLINGSASGSPLVLVDGIPTDLSMINPEDVQSISVLKDAASASIYGARAAFGVVLITTKSGKDNEKMKFSYTGSYGWNNPTKLVDFADGEQELQVMIDAQARAGNNNAESFGMLYKTLLPGVQNWKQNYANNRQSKEMVYGEDWEVIGNRAYFYRLWDPHKEMLGSNTPQTNHTLQMSGKVGPNSTIMASIGYSSKEGTMKINPEQLTRYNANINVNTKLNSWLTSDIRVLATRESYKEPYNYYANGYSGSGYNGYFGYYMRWGTFFPYGTYKGAYFRHAPGYMANANYNDQNTDYIRLSTNLRAKVTKEIDLVAEYSIAKSNVDWRVNGGVLSLWDFWSPMNASTIQTTASPSVLVSPGSTHDIVRSIKSSNETQVFNAYATYRKQLAGGHNFSGQVGINTEWNEFERTYAARQGLLDRDKPEFGLAIGTETSYSTVPRYVPIATEYSIAGFFGRFNYDYQGKYLAEINGRYDGSSKFPTHSQWGFFPSISLGWRISEENFMQSVRPTINNLKLRASVGSIGNQNIRDNAFIPVMSSTTALWLGAGSMSQSMTVNLPSTVSRDLSWESVTSYNLGLDVGLLNMFNINLDLYQRDTRGMLAVGKALPNTFGSSAPFENAGNLRTRGFEVSVDFQKALTNDIFVYASASIGDSRSEVTKWDNDAKTLGTIYKGMVIGEIWGLTTDRLYQASDFTNGQLNSGLPDQSKLRRGSFVFGPGDVMYKDLNNDGKIDNGKGTVDDPGDLTIIGNETPRYEYNFRLGGKFYNFDIDLFFQGVGKRDYWAASDLVLPFYNRTDAMYAHMTDFWTETNTNAYHARPYPGNAANAFTGVTGSNNYARQSRYLLNMAYLRMKNLTVGYTVPANITNKVNIDKLRVYFSGENLFTIQDKNLPVDPEINQTEANWGRSFPYQRTISFGIQLNF